MSRGCKRKEPEPSPAQSSPELALELAKKFMARTGIPIPAVSEKMILFMGIYFGTRSVDKRVYLDRLNACTEIEGALGPEYVQKSVGKSLTARYRNGSQELLKLLTSLFQPQDKMEKILQRAAALFPLGQFALQAEYILFQQALQTFAAKLRQPVPLRSTDHIQVETSLLRLLVPIMMMRTLGRLYRMAPEWGHQKHMRIEHRYSCIHFIRAVFELDVYNARPNVCDRFVRLNYKIGPVELQTTTDYTALEYMANEYLRENKLHPTPRQLAALVASVPAVVLAKQSLGAFLPKVISGLVTDYVGLSLDIAGAIGTITITLVVPTLLPHRVSGTAHHTIGYVAFQQGRVNNASINPANLESAQMILEAFRSVFEKPQQCLVCASDKHLPLEGGVCTRCRKALDDLLRQMHCGEALTESLRDQLFQALCET